MQADTRERYVGAVTPSGLFFSGGVVLHLSRVAAYSWLDTVSCCRPNRINNANVKSTDCSHTECINNAQ